MRRGGGIGRRRRLKIAREQSLTGSSPVPGIWSVARRRSRPSGEGTASVGALFENAYLELVWADTRVSLAEGAEGDIAHFPEASKWQAGGPSPFGIGLRRSTPGSGALPYEGWEVEGADWVEEGQAFFEFERKEGDPAVFVVPDYMALPSWKEQVMETTPEVFDHPAGIATLTAVRLMGSAAPESAAQAGLERVSFEEAGVAPLLELTFDGGAAGSTTDLRPELPIVIRR